MTEEVKKRKPLTKERLIKRVLAYVARYLTSEARLHAYISRLLQRWQEAGGEVQVSEADIVEIVERCRKLNFVDDERFAMIRITRWYKAGHAVSGIRQKLRAESIAPETIVRALETFLREHTDTDVRDLDREAALSYARKRKIGPFRVRDRMAWRQRDLGKLARRGFDRETAEWVLSLEAGLSSKVFH